MAAGLRAWASLAFEDVVVGFSPEEWAELADWQRELYWDVMKENYGLVASLGSEHAQSDAWRAAKRRAGRCIWDGRLAWTPQFPSVRPHQGPVCHTQSCLQAAQVPAAFEDVAVGFSPEEWAELAEWQRELYWAVTRENYELVASLGSTRLCEIGRGEREIPHVPSWGDGSWGDDPEKPGEAQKSLGGAAAGPGPQEKVPNTCKDCGQSFSERGILIVHVLRTHLGERAVACAECGKTLSSRRRLAAHQQAHVRERTFACVECKRSVVYKKHWVDKVRMELAGGKPFRCAKCSYRVVLMVDRLASRGRGAFPCPRCQKVVPTACLLELHQPLHAGEGAGACGECGQRAGRSNALHEQCGSPAGRTPGARPECGRSCPPGGGLTEQGEGQAREGPFPCAQCGRRFRRRGFLATHLRAHVARQPHRGSQRAQAPEGP